MPLTLTLQTVCGTKVSSWSQLCWRRVSIRRVRIFCASVGQLSHQRLGQEAACLRLPATGGGPVSGGPVGHRRGVIWLISSVVLIIKKELIKFNLVDKLTRSKLTFDSFIMCWDM